jgi:3-hydroxybutyrate dehydrogenase
MVRALEGRKALVTGSTGGLGFEIVRGLARAGCEIVMNGLEPAEDAEAQREAVAAEHEVSVHYCQADVSKEAEIVGLIETANKRMSGIDILVNNAVVRHFATIETFPVERWNQAVAVNLSAAFHTIRLTLPIMRKAGWGRIINMSSIYGSVAIAQRVDYVTTKTGLIGMTRVVALETIGEDITCNAVCPGAVLTPYSDNRIKEMMRTGNIDRATAEREFLAKRQPSGRFVDASNVAELVVFLCGPAGRDITGSALPMDAGWLAAD